MKVLVIGSGAREHAMVWALGQSAQVKKIYAAPGNGGTAGEATCENVDLFGRDPSDAEVQDALIRYVHKEHIDLTVVGPEAPLAAGIADRFHAAGLAIVGPTAAAAQLEASKSYAKTFMHKYGVRTANSVSYSDTAAAIAALKNHFKKGSSAAAPIVIKADGLAAGKGVVITDDCAQAEDTVHSFMDAGALGAAGKTILLEQMLYGREVSILAAVSVKDGKGSIAAFASARDHKRRFDGDTGPNTGGMGAIAPVADFTPQLQADFTQAILEPTLHGLKTEGFDYRGFLFFGLLIQDGKSYLLEYNVRLGDPETQAVLPLLKTDFAELCMAIENGSLHTFNLTWKNGAVCAPVVVAKGYPGTYRSGDPIAFNLPSLEKTGARIFAAGAISGLGGAQGTGLRTQGGRVLTVAAYGTDSNDAQERAYRALTCVQFDGMDYRRDIGRAAHPSMPDVVNHFV